MVYIQSFRTNDVIDDAGKQLEFGKGFMNACGWSAGEISVTCVFVSLSDSTSHLDKTKIFTSFKVRGSERGGDRIGVDCKEYSNGVGLGGLKDFFVNKLHLTMDVVGKSYFILESISDDNTKFNLYYVDSSIDAFTLCSKFHQKPFDIIEDEEEKKQEKEERALAFKPIQGGYGKPGMPAFLEAVIKKTLEFDPNLTSLAEAGEFETTDKYLRVRDCKIGVELSHSSVINAVPGHKNDSNPEITWSYNGVVYCVYKELKKPIFDSFIEAYNECYKGNLEIVVTSENGVDVFSLYIIKGKPLHTEQVIIYGAPGTGKSHRVRERVKGKDEFTFRVTFHPDSDYSSFVGAYKPIMKGDKIIYEFAPQAFTKAYIKAWQNPAEDVYLVIEEINRGNCAQIFGDIFQLLDRNENWVSKYPIKADADLLDYLRQDKNLGQGSEGTDKDSLKLPKNLSILATMNTSDQSLFPMDSAFKRRWKWEYVPINYDDAKSFTLHLTDSFTPNWSEVLRVLNSYIKTTTGSANKLIGNRFAQINDNPTISYDVFRDKVLFYLFGDVFKDDESFALDFFNGDANYRCFEDLCEKDNPQFSVDFIKRKMKKEDLLTPDSQETGDDLSA